MAKYQGGNKNNVNYVVVELQNESVTLESGAMHYIQGQIEVESKAPSLGGILKAGVTGENVFKPTYTGTGKIMLEPSFNHFFTLNLNDETYVLDQGAFVAADSAIEVSAHRNKLMTGLRSGEGMFQTKVSGTGTVLVTAPGPPEVLELQNDRLVVDGSFAVARSASLDYTVQKITKSLIGSATSGEGFVNVLEGSGRVYLASVPNFAAMLQSIMYSPYSTS
ncbi:MAG: AIM24 family protein [Vampirovibrio sp.]|nr:AIM24 family protein [Vampirovibrio sp.]